MSGRGFRVVLSTEDSEELRKAIANRPRPSLWDRLTQSSPLLALLAVSLQGVTVGGLGYAFVRGGLVPAAPAASQVDSPAPRTGAIHGLDVSHYQGAVDWDSVALAAGTSGTPSVAFVYVKATEGRTIVDPQFRANWSGPDTSTIAVGAYHVFEPEVSAEAQARHFLGTVGDAPGRLPPVLDVELAGGDVDDSLQDGVRIWLEVVEREMGCRPIVYTNPAFWSAYMSDDFGEYGLWLADYSAEPSMPPGWTTWTFWQYTPHGTHPGVRGAVDLDRFNGDASALSELRCGP